MITSAFEQISTLQLRLKASRNEVKDFKSGAKYVQMKNQYDTDIRRLKKRLCKRDRLIAGLRIRIIKNRDMWFEQTGKPSPVPAQHTCSNNQQSGKASPQMLQKKTKAGHVIPK